MEPFEKLDMGAFEKLIRIAKYYGYDAQSRQCIEEMAELTQAINKYWRKALDYGKVPIPENGYMHLSPREYGNLVEEIADVQIVLWQIQHLLNADMMPIIHKKLDREIERIEKC